MIQADALALPLASNTVDLIVTSPPFPGFAWGRDYFSRLAQAKEEMRRVLKPTGTALVLQMKVRPKSWWWAITSDFTKSEVCIRAGRVLPPLSLPGWQRTPEDDVTELVLLYSGPGDLVVDPFSGSGTVARVAEREGRRGISLDVSRETQFLTVVD